MQPLDGIGRYIQDTVLPWNSNFHSGNQYWCVNKNVTYLIQGILALGCYILHWLHACAISDEQMISGNQNFDSIGLIKQILLQIVVVLARLDEQVGLDVGLHLLHWGDKVIIPSVHLKNLSNTSCQTWIQMRVEGLAVCLPTPQAIKIFSRSYLILPARPRCVRNAGTKSFWKLSHKVVVDSVFHWAQDYHRPKKNNCHCLLKTKYQWKRWSNLVNSRSISSTGS